MNNLLTGEKKKEKERERKREGKQHTANNMKHEERNRQTTFLAKTLNSFVISGLQH